MNKYKEALVELLENMDYKDYSTQTLNKCCEAINKLQELVDKHEQLEQENFDLRNKLNTEEECCAMLEKKVKKQVEIIKSLCKALEGNEIDLSYLIFSYLTPEEWLYCKKLLDYVLAKEAFEEDE
jgi:hypothetical protein